MILRGAKNRSDLAMWERIDALKFELTELNGRMIKVSRYQEGHPLCYKYGLCCDSRFRDDGSFS